MTAADARHSQRVLGVACLLTTRHCASAVSKAVPRHMVPGEVPAKDPRAEEELDACLGRAWMLVRHRVCSHAASLLLVGCARQSLPRRCRLLREGLEALAGIELAETAALQSVLGVLCVCAEAWRLEVRSQAQHLSRAPSPASAVRWCVRRRRWTRPIVARATRTCAATTTRSLW